MAGATTSLLELPFRIGEAVEHRGIVICPVLSSAEPLSEYLTLEEAIPQGLRITEVDAAGSVPELLVVNPLDRDVLLYDGEELSGAKQDRILNVSVLVAAQSQTPIPVSCVEAGRWRARSDAFAAAGHAAYPELRRRKAERLAGDPLARGRAQAEVWSSVGDKAARLGVRSPTGASADVYRDRRAEMAELRTAFPLHPRQCGALLALGTDGMCLDYLSRSSAFAELYPKLLDGYLLDALEGLDRPAAAKRDLEDFVTALSGAECSIRPSAGLGEDLRLTSRAALGTGLVYGGELLQLSAFSQSGRPMSRSPVAPPSRRR